jgi:hypothetical protein
MKSRSIRRLGILAAVLSIIGGVNRPAFADTVQGFQCDNRSSVALQGPTSHDKKFVIPSINKIAVLVDAGAKEPVGINYDVNPPQPMRFITWYYKQAQGSRALQALTVRYCVQKADGSEQQSFDIQGGASDRGGPVGDGWSDVIQDTRVFPSIVVSGQAVLTKLTFIFKDKTKANNITLGKVVINPGSINPSLISDVGPCDLKEKCTK